ncbi:hypothetical protein C0099_14245 [Pseudazoarcus pumilus]|uniref:Methyltransferase type 11 domain-containing protein n=1 Tax=Pseudazoarcus pumilus TaxID=2067960 RepID=A0A2I6S9T4_9RHOO|nr:hypothetical protein C0099_14245 [Pseudazoarcus pumilus]
MFVSLRPDPFMTRCLRCRANGTNLSLIPVIREHMAGTPVRKAWEMSTYGATLDFLRRELPDVVASEYFEGVASGTLVDGVRCEDVQATSFADASLDLVTSNQVFEHVPDDLAGYAECARILRPGGALVFSVPLYDIPVTRRLARIEDGRVIVDGEAEYHDSRASGPKSVLTFWRHSVHDIAARVAAAGFDVALREVRVATSQRHPAFVVYAMRRV